MRGIVALRSNRMSIWCAMPWPNFQWTWSEPHLQRVWLRGGKLAVVTKGSSASLTNAEEMDANRPICRPIFGCMRGWAELRQGRPDWLALTPRTSKLLLRPSPWWSTILQPIYVRLAEEKECRGADFRREG